MCVCLRALFAVADSDALPTSRPTHRSVVRNHGATQASILRANFNESRLNAKIGQKVVTPQHGLHSNRMALITSDCGKMRSLSIKWL